MKCQEVHLCSGQQRRHWSVRSVPWSVPWWGQRACCRRWRTGRGAGNRRAWIATRRRCACWAARWWWRCSAGSMKSKIPACAGPPLRSWPSVVRKRRWTCPEWSSWSRHSPHAANKIFKFVTVLSCGFCNILSRESDQGALQKCESSVDVFSRKSRNDLNARHLTVADVVTWGRLHQSSSLVLFDYKLLLSRNCHLRKTCSTEIW